MAIGLGPYTTVDKMVQFLSIIGKTTVQPAITTTTERSVIDRL